MAYRSNLFASGSYVGNLGDTSNAAFGPEMGREFPHARASSAEPTARHTTKVTTYGRFLEENIDAVFYVDQVSIFATEEIMSWTLLVST